MTGLPTSVGSSRRSTDTKNVSRSRQQMRGAARAIAGQYTEHLIRSLEREENDPRRIRVRLGGLLFPQKLRRLRKVVVALAVDLVRRGRALVGGGILGV